MKKIKIILIILFIAIISYVIFISISGCNNAFIVNEEFIINFIGIILGIEVAVITLIYSSIDKLIVNIKDSLHNEEEKRNRLIRLMYSAINELIDNGRFIFILFIIEIVIVISNHNTLKLSFMSLIKSYNLLLYLQILDFCLVLYAVYDSLEILFNLIKMTLIIGHSFKTKDLKGGSKNNESL